MGTAMPLKAFGAYMKRLRERKGLFTAEGRKCRHADVQTCRHDEKLSALAEDDGSADSFEPVSTMSASALSALADLPDASATNGVCTNGKTVSALSALAGRPFGYVVTPLIAQSGRE